MITRNKTYISFDWALKRLLRDKANFVVLEGFVSTLLEMPIKIHRLLESESNKDHEEAKLNRVDILAENGRGELLLVEVQGESEYAYFQRILFGTSKLVTEYINSGQNYENVKKVYSINIVYFDLVQVRTMSTTVRPSFAVSTMTTCCSCPPFSVRSLASTRFISSIQSIMS